MIDSRRLRTLRAVADHGTVTAAAALYLTPSLIRRVLTGLRTSADHARPGWQDKGPAG
ncbi:hypothetical protein Acor_15520 [Acrocarpospora corrugata]|uniref:Uncharacterized protein n=1 Tax=Acrocarpospora corrugata TaxID=35763 RepID=A0A5M3VTD0_9ACTN|nr:hypothetical protein Acor_15520 [Acrocarpospora corrugata]